MSDAVDAMLAVPNGFTVAAAGCGKTELLGQIAAHEKSGRQLILTHTHAGVAAIKRRLGRMNVPASKYHLETIAGWCLRYGAAYPEISGVAPAAEANPDWEAAYPGAEWVVRTPLGKRIICESYDGVLVDEYQDCILSQHAVVTALSEILPVRGVGDPLQSVFGFADDPVVSGKEIEAVFQEQEPLLHPWRWTRPGENAALGEWIQEARQQLVDHGRLRLDADAPVSWVQYDDQDTWAEACKGVGGAGESTVAILQWPNQCIELAKRLGGRWPVVEKFDHPELFDCADALAAGDGVRAARALFEFLAARTTRLGPALRRLVDAITDGRSTTRFSKHPLHAERLRRLADAPSAATALELLEGVLAEREWWVYRRECVYQLRAALQECIDEPPSSIPDAAAAARTRARHRGRRMHARSIGTPLLVKGLEFDHSIVLWEPHHFSLEGLYVAITRGSKSLTVVSRRRVLSPEES